MLAIPTLLVGAILVEHYRSARADLSLANGLVAAAPVPGATQIDLRGHLVFPGLVSAHDHLHLNTVPPLPHSQPFPNSYAWAAAFAPHFADPAVAAALVVDKALRHWQGGLRHLLAGTTTVAHHDPWHPILDHPAFPVRLLRRFGWAHSLGLGLARNAAYAIPPLRDAIRDLHIPSYGPDLVASYRNTPPDTPWVMHLAEGTDDLAQQELALLDDLGCLGANTVLVHGVGVTERDQERIIAAGAAVIWCPASNMGMLGRTLMPRRLAAAGRLALGTDSRLTGSRDMLNELRVARRHSDLAPAELLRFATADAARILGLTGVGTLAAGACADLLILPDSGGDPYAALLSAHRSDIRAVVLGGIPVVADPDFAPWFEHCGLETTPATLDGRPKLIARNLLGPPGVSALEPGLVVHM